MFHPGESAAQQRAGESYLASLRDELQQITLTRNEYRLLRAEQLGVAKEAQVLITAIDRQNGQLAENEARVRALAQAEREAAAAKANGGDAHGHDEEGISMREMLFMISTGILTILLVVVSMRRRPSMSETTELS